MTAPTAEHHGRRWSALRVAIIGSGFSGLAAAIAMVKHGIEDFTIFEQASGLGGTWWHNRYPGAEVDLESHLYSFSFEPYDWTRTHADWREIQGYLRHVATKWGILDHIRFDEKVEQVRWCDDEDAYVVTTSSGVVPGAFDAVISAVGFLNIPLIPPFARGDVDYEGVVCHTSTWPEGLDLAGKRVGVVGTGSSAVQVVTEAEKRAAEVRVFQLEPNWLLPKNSRDFSAAERRWNRVPLVAKFRRRKLYAQYDVRQMRASHARKDGLNNRRRHRASLRFLQESLAGRPELRDAVTPLFPFEGKRTVVSDTYYGSLTSPTVTLVPHGVKELSRTGVLDANGDEHDLDVVVLATGFEAANYLGNYRVLGADGVELHERWQGEPAAFLGTMVPGFPNFFIMYGPNTNSIPLISFYEAQARFAAKSISRLAEPDVRHVAVRESAYHLYNEWLQARLAHTVWAGTENYFRAGTGRVVSQWPFSATAYILATRLLRRPATVVRRRS